jgi:DNA invertase Pin-like site-specific DNA recombinase
MFIRAYLRASTNQQDSQRARADLDSFASERGLKIAAYYSENESGASLTRPELFRLLDDSHPGDVLLIEQVDRLSRLSGPDWDVLKAKLREKSVRVVALDLPTSWQLVAQGDDLTQRMMDALNSMMLDMLAAIARKDYEDRRRRTAQGIAKAKLIEGRYAGRPVDHVRVKNIVDMLAKDMSWSQVCEITGASRSTLARIVKEQKASAAA